MGLGPQVADLDGDGNPELLSGSWPGELFLFRGLPGRAFAAPEMLKGKDGKVLNPGGGIEKRPGFGTLVKGSARFENTPEGSFVVYGDLRLKSTDEDPVSISGTASAVHVADWDGDGDLDLLVGVIEGRVYLVPNEGTPKAWAYGEPRLLVAGGKDLQVKGDAGPWAADWDADGDLDLLVGAGDGSVVLYANSGTRREPKLDASRSLVPGVTWNAADEPKPGMRAKPCAVDWDGDGDLDLLVGDFALQKAKAPDQTPEEKARVEAGRKELKNLQAKASELAAKQQAAKDKKDADLARRLGEESGALWKRIGELGKSLPSETEYHGWVWLHERK